MPNPYSPQAINSLWNRPESLFLRIVQYLSFNRCLMRAFGLITAPS
ncbi:hypothetical protein QUB16_15810 [Microcoleus sp. D3_18a_C4]